MEIPGTLTLSLPVRLVVNKVHVKVYVNTIKGE